VKQEAGDAAFFGRKLKAPRGGERQRRVEIRHHGQQVLLAQHVLAQAGEIVRTRFDADQPPGRETGSAQACGMEIEAPGRKPHDLARMAAKDPGDERSRAHCHGLIVSGAADLMNGPAREAAFKVSVDRRESGREPRGCALRAVAALDPRDLLAQQRHGILIVRFHLRVPLSGRRLGGNERGTQARNRHPVSAP
jgi:hypothetical protein